MKNYNTPRLLRDGSFKSSNLEPSSMERVTWLLVGFFFGVLLGVTL